MLAEISFYIDSSNSSVPLGFEAQLDGQTQFNAEHVQQSTLVKILVDDQVETQHTLKLILKNKLPDHTKVDNSGKIITDSVLKINDISFDQTPIGAIVFKQAQYTHDFNGTQSIIQEKFFGTMGCNGTVELKFTTPIYLWLLENNQR